MDGLNLRVRRRELRYRHGRLSNRVRFRQPIKAVENCRVAMQPPIHPGKASDSQHNRKYDKGEAASGETAQTFSSWWRVNPAVHKNVAGEE